MPLQKTFTDLEEKIKILSETAWYDRHLNWSEVAFWLKQFENNGNNDEQLQCLFLLSHFMYFGRNEMREMLKSLYRDLYKYQIVSEIRQGLGNTKDRSVLESHFTAELNKTRFLGIGNPSESGTHLLYFFRQENHLPKDLFINGHEIFNRDITSQKLTLKNTDIERYIFIDDLTGSGTQALKYSEELVKDIKAANPKAIVSYYVLFATDKALDIIRTKGQFHEVKCLFELDSSYKCFESESRYFKNELLPIKRDLAKQVCEKYDAPINKALCEKEGDPLGTYYMLGFESSQLLLGFYHNTPDNTPPVFWYDGVYDGQSQWMPIFNRYHKVY